MAKRDDAATLISASIDERPSFSTTGTSEKTEHKNLPPDKSNVPNQDENCLKCQDNNSYDPEDASSNSDDKKNTLIAGQNFIREQNNVVLTEENPMETRSQLSIRHTNATLPESSSYKIIASPFGSNFTIDNISEKHAMQTQESRNISQTTKILEEELQSHVRLCNIPWSKEILFELSSYFPWYVGCIVCGKASTRES